MEIQPQVGDEATTVARANAQGLVRRHHMQKCTQLVAPPAPRQD